MNVPTVEGLDRDDGGDVAAIANHDFLSRRGWACASGSNATAGFLRNCSSTDYHAGAAVVAMTLLLLCCC